MKKTIKIICLCLALCLFAGAFASCGKQKTLMTLEEKTLSVNVYEFLLSRMKGTLGYYGYDITSEAFWRTVVSSDGTTYDDYFCAEIEREAKYYLVADHLFDEYGLKLSPEDEKKIDDLMTKHEKKAGSRTALNEKLKAFGVNYDTLREIYVLESKINALKLHLYGKDASLVSDVEKQQYLDENYVCFEQIFIATYYYLTDLDRFGDVVYYTDEKHTAIAYDKVNGKTDIDETGNVATDVLGDPEYYTEDGKIAYDKQKGVVGYVYEKDKDGKPTENRVIANYDEKTKGQLFENAKEYAEVCNKNTDKFDEYKNQYGTEDTAGRMYLFASAGYYASLSDSAAYFDDIAEELCEMEIGECRVVSSDYGYHVVIKRENEAGAYADKDMKESFFADFSDNLIEFLWTELCEEHVSKVKVDKEVLGGAPNMKEVGANVLY